MHHYLKMSETNVDETIEASILDLPSVLWRHHVIPLLPLRALPRLASACKGLRDTLYGDDKVL
jgi:hypothetical protein